MSEEKKERPRPETTGPDAVVQNAFLSPSALAARRLGKRSLVLKGLRPTGSASLNELSHGSRSHFTRRESENPDALDQVTTTTRVSVPSRKEIKTATSMEEFFEKASEATIGLLKSFSGEFEPPPPPEPDLEAEKVDDDEGAGVNYFSSGGAMAVASPGKVEEKDLDGNDDEEKTLNDFEEDDEIIALERQLERLKREKEMALLEEEINRMKSTMAKSTTAEPILKDALNADDEEGLFPENVGVPLFVPFGRSPLKVGYVPPSENLEEEKEELAGGCTDYILCFGRYTVPPSQNIHPIDALVQEAVLEEHAENLNVEPMNTENDTLSGALSLEQIDTKKSFCATINEADNEDDSTALKDDSATIKDETETKEDTVQYMDGIGFRATSNLSDIDGIDDRGVNHNIDLSRFAPMIEKHNEDPPQGSCTNFFCWGSNYLLEEPEGAANEEADPMGKVDTSIESSPEKHADSPNIEGKSETVQSAQDGTPEGNIALQKTRSAAMEGAETPVNAKDTSLVNDDSTVKEIEESGEPVQQPATSFMCCAGEQFVEETEEANEGSKLAPDASIKHEASELENATSGESTQHKEDVTRAILSSVDPSVENDALPKDKNATATEDDDSPVAIDQGEEGKRGFASSFMCYAGEHVDEEPEMAKQEGDTTDADMSAPEAEVSEKSLGDPIAPVTKDASTDDNLVVEEKARTRKSLFCCSEDFVDEEPAEVAPDDDHVRADIDATSVGSRLEGDKDAETNRAFDATAEDLVVEGNRSVVNPETDAEVSNELVAGSSLSMLFCFGIHQVAETMTVEEIKEDVDRKLEDIKGAETDIADDKQDGQTEETGGCEPPAADYPTKSSFFSCFCANETSEGPAVNGGAAEEGEVTNMASADTKEQTGAEKTKDTNIDSLQATNDQSQGDKMDSIVDANDDIDFARGTTASSIFSCFGGEQAANDSLENKVESTENITGVDEQTHEDNQDAILDDSQIVGTESPPGTTSVFACYGGETCAGTHEENAATEGSDEKKQAEDINEHPIDEKMDAIVDDHAEQETAAQKATSSIFACFGVEECEATVKDETIVTGEAEDHIVGLCSADAMDGTQPAQDTKESTPEDEKDAILDENAGAEAAVQSDTPSMFSCFGVKECVGTTDAMDGTQLVERSEEQTREDETKVIVLDENAEQNSAAQPTTSSFFSCLGFGYQDDPVTSTGETSDAQITPDTYEETHDEQKDSVLNEDSGKEAVAQPTSSSSSMFSCFRGQTEQMCPADADEARTLQDTITDPSQDGKTELSAEKNLSAFSCFSGGAVYEIPGNAITCKDLRNRGTCQETADPDSFKSQDLVPLIDLDDTMADEDEQVPVVEEPRKKTVNLGPWDFICGDLVKDKALDEPTEEEKKDPEDNIPEPVKVEPSTPEMAYIMSVSEKVVQDMRGSKKLLRKERKKIDPETAFLYAVADEIRKNVDDTFSLGKKKGAKEQSPELEYLNAVQRDLESLITIRITEHGQPSKPIPNSDLPPELVVIREIAGSVPNAFGPEIAYLSQVARDMKLHFLNDMGPEIGFLTYSILGPSPSFSQNKIENTANNRNHRQHAELKRAESTQTSATQVSQRLPAQLENETTYDHTPTSGGTPINEESAISPQQPSTSTTYAQLSEQHDVSSTQITENSNILHGFEMSHPVADVQKAPDTMVIDGVLSEETELVAIDSGGDVPFDNLSVVALREQHDLNTSKETTNEKTLAGKDQVVCDEVETNVCFGTEADAQVSAPQNTLVPPSGETTTAVSEQASLAQTEGCSASEPVVEPETVTSGAVFLDPLERDAPSPSPAVETPDYTQSTSLFSFFWSQRETPVAKEKAVTDEANSDQSARVLLERVDTTVSEANRNEVFENALSNEPRSPPQLEENSLPELDEIPETNDTPSQPKEKSLPVLDEIPEANDEEAGSFDTLCSPTRGGDVEVEIKKSSSDFRSGQDEANHETLDVESDENTDVTVKNEADVGGEESLGEGPTEADADAIIAAVSSAKSEITDETAKSEDEEADAAEAVDAPEIPGIVSVSSN
ncbi:hypothetical protein ACA910_000738 [Epithemia clementina (nom. ined.)]